MVTIVFEAHSTRVDNETHLASGWYDVPLSELGEKQSLELGERYKDERFDAIFCSDLQRSYKTAEIAFSKRDFPIIKGCKIARMQLWRFDKARHESSKGKTYYETVPEW